MAGGLQSFFGDDWDDAFDSIKSTPAAMGGIMLSAARQLRGPDAVALALVFAGWIWIGATFFSSGFDQLAWHVALGAAPTVLWLSAGVIGALIFEIGGLGFRTMAYWEAYVLILVLAIFGLLSLRVALSRHEGDIHRGPTSQTT
jgi:hypothetical protein